MHIGSTAFAHNSNIPDLYTCKGQGMCPPLEFSDIPTDAESLLLLVDDPDAVSGLFTHWILFDIPPSVKYVDKNTIPEGAGQGLNSSGRVGFVAPCPPKGTGMHHYRFKLFALNKKLSLQEGATIQEVESEMQGNILTQSELVGLYGQ